MSVQNTSFESLSARCAICGAPANRVLVSRGGYDVHSCEQCGLAFTHPQPVDLAEQYDSSYFELYRRRRPFRLRRANERLKRIELLRKPGRLLDIGCSLGYFVEAAGARGWSASGVEISPAAAAEARDAGLDVRSGTLEDACLGDASFDCVTMWDVLEHVPDPVRHMREVHRVLGDGGLVVIGTPDISHIAFHLQRENWRHLKPSEHVFYFNRGSLCRLLALTGFRAVKPSLISRRRSAGSLGTAVKSAIAGAVRVSDVLTVYGVKDELQV